MGCTIYLIYPQLTSQYPVMGAHSIGYHSHIIRNTMVSPVWKGCQAGISVLAIQSNGNIKGCLSLPDDGFIEGNIKEESIIDIWRSPNSFSFSRNFGRSELKDHCKECKYGRTCKGGCTTASVSITKKMHCDPYCLYKIENEIM